MTARVERIVVELEEFGIAEGREAGDVPDWAKIDEGAPEFEQSGRRIGFRYKTNE